MVVGVEERDGRGEGVGLDESACWEVDLAAAGECVAVRGFAGGFEETFEQTFNHVRRTAGVRHQLLGLEFAKFYARAEGRILGLEFQVEAPGQLAAGRLCRDIGEDDFGRIVVPRRIEPLDKDAIAHRTFLDLGAAFARGRGPDTGG